MSSKYFGIAERDYYAGEVIDLDGSLSHVFEVLLPIHQGDEIYFDTCDEKYCKDCY